MNSCELRQNIFQGPIFSYFQDHYHKKINESFPTEIILVLDGNIGQNSVKQAEVFKEICNIDSIIITKLDGTAKGGVLVPIAELLNLPISYIGTGEQKEDLINFKAKEYTQTLLDLN